MEILDSRKLTYSKFHAEDTQTLGLQ